MRPSGCRPLPPRAERSVCREVTSLAFISLTLSGSLGVEKDARYCGKEV